MPALGERAFQRRRQEEGRRMTILPEGEQIRRAVKWISDQRQEAPETPLPRLIGEACLKFDLSPKDAETLVRLLNENPQGTDNI